MATVVFLAGTMSGTNTGGAVTAVPAVGDSIILINENAYTGASNRTSPNDDNPDGLGGTGGYTLIRESSNGDGLGNGFVLSVWIRNSPIGVSASTGFSVQAPATPLAWGGAVIALRGMPSYGIGSVRQNKFATPVAALASTGVWTSNKLVQNPVIGVLLEVIASGAVFDPTAGYTEVYDTASASPARRMEIQTLNRGDTTNTMIWNGANAASMRGVVIGVEFSTPTPTVLDLLPADFKMTGVANAIAPKALMTFSPPQLKLTPTTIQLLRKLSFQVAAFDLGRPSIQLTRLATLGTADFKFTPSEAVSVGELWPLEATIMDFVAYDIEMVISVELFPANLDFFADDIGLIIGPSLDAATFDFVGQNLLVGFKLGLDPATFDFVGQDVSVAKTIELDVEADGLEFTTLPIDARNRPPGVVADLIPGLFNFVPLPLGIKTVVSLTSAIFDLVPAPTGTSSFINVTLGVTTFNFVTGAVNPVAEPVIILLTTANFKFNARLIQLTGISSAGDRKRMLFGVGR